MLTAMGGWVRERQKETKTALHKKGEGAGCWMMMAHGISLGELIGSEIPHVAARSRKREQETNTSVSKVTKLAQEKHPLLYFT